MLKKPVRTQAEPQKSELSSVLEAEFHDMAMERINNRAYENALAELGPKITDAESRATTAEAELAGVKAMLAELQAKHKNMEAMHNAEKSAKDAANRACDEECEKTRKLEIQASQMTGRIAELERHNASLQGNLSAVTVEISKRKSGFSLFPETKTVPTIPNFDFEVTSRGLKGEIKTMTFKPKK